VGGVVVQFGGLVNGSRNAIHCCNEQTLKLLDLPGLVAGFDGKLVSAIRILERSFRVPERRSAVPFFVMFRGSAMGLCRKFV
jgi:hypothetical protein